MGTIGEKRKRIQIKARTQVADGQGGHTATYPTTRCTVWAHERPLTGAEALRAAQVTAVVSSVWEIWFREDLSVTDRIAYKTRVVNIEAIVDPSDLRDELHLFCSEVQA